MNEGLDVLVLTETWHGSSNDISVKMAMPSGYSFVDYIRPLDPFHGGLIIYFRTHFRHKKLELPLFKTFEAVAIKLSINSKDNIVLAIYRPITKLFFTDLITNLNHITILCSQIILAGDFNVHLERVNDPHTVSLLDVFDMF